MVVGGIRDYNKICIRLIDASTSEDMYDLVTTIQDDVHGFAPLTGGHFSVTLIIL